MITFRSQSRIKNVNSFHWTKFDMSCCIQSWRNIPGMVWVHSLNYIIIKRKKKCVMHTQFNVCEMSFLRSHAPSMCCFFFVNIRIWQNDALVSIHITVFCPQFKKSCSIILTALSTTISKLNLILGSWNDNIYFQKVFEYLE